MARSITIKPELAAQRAAAEADAKKSSKAKPKADASKKAKPKADKAAKADSKKGGSHTQKLAKKKPR